MNYRNETFNIPVDFSYFERTVVRLNHDLNVYKSLDSSVNYKVRYITGLQLLGYIESLQLIKVPYISYLPEFDSFFLDFSSDSIFNSEISEIFEILGLSDFVHAVVEAV